MTSQIQANRHTRELENMERTLARIARELEQEMLISDQQIYKPLIMPLDNHKPASDTYSRADREIRT